MAFHLYSRGSAKGVYLQNVILFPTFLKADIRWGFDAIWNVSIMLNTSATIQYTTDGGVTWFNINPPGALPALDERIFNIKAGDKDLFNLRTPNANVDVYRVLISIAPQDILRPRSDIDVNIPIPLPVDVVDQPINVNLVNAPTLEINQRLQLQKLADIEDVLYLIVLQLQDITGTKYSIRDIDWDVRRGR